MAGATEVEQIKTNQLLEKVSKDTSESLRGMGDLILAVQQPSEYEKEAIASDKESTALDKKAQKHDKEVLKGDKTFHKDFDEFSKKEIVHNKFIETTENKKAGLAKAALSDQKRKDKLLTRGAKGAWNWTKDKAEGIAKSTMGFMGTIGKLMMLVAAWFLMQWLKGKDLKKWWDNFLEVIDNWKDTLEKWTNWVSVVTKDLDKEYFHFTSAWLGWKAMLKVATSTLNSIATGMKTWFGVDAALTRQLTKLSTNIANLLKEEAAIQRLINATDDLAVKKPLAKKLQEVRIALTAALEDEAAIARAKKFADALAKEKQLAKQLGLADDALKLAIHKESVASKALKLGQTLSPEGKVAQQLALAADEVAKITKEKSVLHEAIRLNQELKLSLAQDARAAKISLETAKKIKDAELTVTKVKPVKPAGFPRVANPKLVEFLKGIPGLEETGDTLEEIKTDAKILGETDKQRKKFKGSVHAESWGAWWADKTKGIRALLREHQRLGLAGSVGKLVGSGFEKVKLASEAIGLTGWIKKALRFLGILGDVLLAIEAIRGIWAGEKTPGGKGVSAGIASPSMIMTTDMATIVENVFDKMFGDKEWGGKIGIDWKPLKERWMTKTLSHLNKNLWGELFNKIGDPKKDDQGNLIFNEKGEQEFVEWWNMFALRGGAFVTDKEDKQWKPIANAFLNAFEQGGIFKGEHTLMTYLALRLKGYDFKYDPTGESKNLLDVRNLRKRSGETERQAASDTVEELKKLVEALKIIGKNTVNELGRNAGVLAPVTINNASTVMSASPLAIHPGSEAINLQQ